QAALFHWCAPKEMTRGEALLSVGTSYTEVYPRAASCPASRGMWWSAARHQEPVLPGRPWPPSGLPATDRASQWLPVARREKGTPWRVHQREQGGTGSGTQAVEKAL